jgi:hypothetical protein
MSAPGRKTEVSLDLEQPCFETFGTFGSTKMRVRRVLPKDRPEHVQIDLTVINRGEKRTSQHHGYIELTPEQVPMLVNALTKMWPAGDWQGTWIARDLELRKHYDLPKKDDK